MRTQSTLDRRTTSPQRRQGFGTGPCLGCGLVTRAAFTLTELLVVIAIIAAMAALIAFVMPGFQQRSRAAKGAGALQGWLNYARGRALYEQAPRGIRFIFAPQKVTVAPSPNPPTELILPVVVECQYLEQPDDWSGGPLVPDPAFPTDPSKVKVTGANFSDRTVEVGDKLEVLGSGQAHLIVDIQESDPKNNPGVFDKLVLYSPLTNPISEPIKHYRIQRAPRVAGDDSLKMPDGVIITSGCAGFPDPYMTTQYSMWGGFMPTPVYSDSPTNSRGYIDILFSPSGAVLGAGSEKIIFWVRVATGYDDSGANAEFAVNPTLLVIYTNSGAVAAFDPTPGPGGPYQKVQ